MENDKCSFQINKHILGKYVPIFDVKLPDPWEDFYYVNDAARPSYTKEMTFALCDAFFRNPSALNFENKIQWIKNVTRKISQMKLSSSWVIIVMVGLTYLLSKPNAIVSLRKASWKKSCLFENAASLFLYSPPPFAKDLYFFFQSRLLILLCHIKPHLI